MATADTRVVDSNYPPSAEIDLGVEGQRTHRSAHIAYFWETEKEFVGAIGFLEAGLQCSDHCVIFGHEEANQAVCRVLEEHGYDLRSLSTTGRISIIGGDPSGQTILENIGAAFQRALDKGASLVRLLGNIGWGKNNWPEEHDLLAFEAKVTEAVQQFPCVVVCMYDLHSLPARVLQHGGFETHPYLMMGSGSIRQNSYYVPTNLFMERVEAIAAEMAERKRRDDALKRSEERFRTLFESAPLGISINDAEGRFVHVNRTFQEMLGYSASELTQLSFRDVTFGDDLAESKQLFGELVQGKRQAFQVEKRYVRKDGSVLWAGTRCSAVRDANGNFAYTFAMVADISERKRSSEALQKSEERVRMLLEINNAIITKRTRDELFHTISEALRRVIPFDRLALSLYEPELNSLRIVTYAGSYQRTDYSPIGRVLDLSDSPAGWAFSHQKPFLRPDLEIERQTSSEERAYGHGFRSLCALPLIVRGKSIGALTVGSLARFQYTEADAEFLMEVAKQIAIAVDNMKSYENIAALNATIGETAERRRTLLDINNAIISNLTQEALFHAVSQALRRLIPFDRIAIFLHDPHRDVLRLFVLESSLPVGRYTVGLEWAPEESHAGWAFQHQQPLLRQDLEKERHYPTEDLLFGDGVRSFLVVPLIVRGVSIGTLNLNSTTPNRYSESDALLMQEVASQIALAIDNMKSYEEIVALKARAEAESVYLQEEIKTEYNFEEIIGQSTPLKQLLRKVEQVAPTEATVLIQGETGTGKELLARAIHNLSPRKERPLVKVNCGAIPAGLVESELFGHEKGAFTGALQRRIGRFELANGGTIFLDEVTELPLDTQVKLLRVLQEGEFERVGSSQTLKVDVRVIAATNRDLKEVVKNGTLRSDLFYRLNVFPVEVPPLRERKSDIPLVVNFFLTKFAKKLGKEIKGISQRAMESLMNYDWPGNVRELQNVIERAVVLASGAIVHVDDSVLHFDPGIQETSLDTLENVERTHILRALSDTKWVVHGKKGAAAILGMNPSTLRSRMEKLGITRPAST